MSITPEAFAALQALHDGARYNIVHTTARELIDAGLAHAGFGILEITEAGRIWVRRGVTPARSYIVDDANVANLDTPVPSSRAHDVTFSQDPFELAPEAPPVPETLPPAPLANGTLAWSRDRAVRAAGIACGKADHWPPPSWIDAFMEAYEAH